MNDAMKHTMTGVAGAAAGLGAYLVKAAGDAMGCTNVPTTGGQWAAIAGTALLAVVAGQLGLRATPPVKS